MDKVKMILNYAKDFSLEPELVERLRRTFPNVAFVEIEGESCLLEQLEDVNVFVGWPTETALFGMPALRWLQLPSAGADGYVDCPALGSDVILTNARGVFGVPGAEHAVALMLAFARQLHVHMDQQRRRTWRSNQQSLEVQDSTVTVIGLGDIGAETARRAKALGAHVLAVRRGGSVASAPPYVDKLYGVEGLEEALGQSDYVVSALPSTPQTRGFLSADRVASMKPGAVFVNVGRGDTVDEAALIRALRAGELEGAGLDVTETEPLPEDSPLWSLPNVIITSHSVGVSPRKAERRVKLLEWNLGRFLCGEPLDNVVDRELGY